jgi:hypothetical protein
LGNNNEDYLEMLQTDSRLVGGNGNLAGNNTQ